MLAQLRSESDLSSAEGRAGFIAAAKPHLERVAAPALRVQLANAIAELARVSEEDVRELLALPGRPAAQRPVRPRARFDAPTSPEWSLLAGLVNDLTMIEHVEPDLLTPELPESRALLAIRDFCERGSEDPSFRLLIDALEGDPALDLVLRAQRFADEVGFDEAESRSEVMHALTKLELRRRRGALDALLQKGLHALEDQKAYQEQLMAFKRLQGALPPT